ncbi:hypothetical protein BDV32DRAFT_121892 [Aspergillus pseudonomiae]|uniref:Uncharacterized protein n=1 Tax=Aspergillus pseudonomiae TaxID=1506151 RepID=A0A5N6I473_9EURO|nr:uncharacterized protein BDV37DRAFT_131233 [Aspergillus pseudonomiae]KAB8261198.1 hypothetical protein BDV32DRAFT_121892 [Aspergillus pseudonomiae]KAE8403705.1 hypothetical protein BDV37DRAFT_131233 [Aspergillus pseudonomiae]
MLRYSSPMNPHAAACPPMEHSYSTSSEESMQSPMGYYEVYAMASNDMELYHAQSNASSYSSSYPSSNYSYSSSFGSSYDSGSFEASSYDSASYDFTTPPPVYCPPDLNPQFAPQYFSSPVQGTWPTPPAQVTPVEDFPYPPLETHFTPCETAKPAKPYVCECGRAFTRPADLKRHESSVHNPVFQDCPVQGCIRKDSNGFPRRDHLIEHLRSYHHLDVPKRRAATKRVAKAA